MSIPCIAYGWVERIRWTSVTIFPGREADGCITLPDQFAIAFPVVVEGPTVGMEIVAVQLDDKPPGHHQVHFSNV